MELDMATETQLTVPNTEIPPGDITDITTVTTGTHPDGMFQNGITATTEIPPTQLTDGDTTVTVTDTGETVLLTALAAIIDQEMELDTVTETQLTALNTETHPENGDTEVITTSTTYLISITQTGLPMRTISPTGVMTITQEAGTIWELIGLITDTITILTLATLPTQLNTTIFQISTIPTGQQLRITPQTGSTIQFPMATTTSEPPIHPTLLITRADHTTIRLLDTKTPLITTNLPEPTKL